MNTVIKQLSEWGCDVEGALNRFIGDEQLYMACLHTVLEDEAFEGLRTALENGDVKAAFDHAHTLKGVLANMGLTPMYDTTVLIVEPLRAGEQSKELLLLCDKLAQEKEKLAGILLAA